MDYIYIGLIAVAAIVVIVGGVKIVRRIRYKIYRVNNFFGNLLLKNGMELQNEIIEETPKSVSGMTRLCLPRIIKDFPDFDYTYYRQLTENLIKGIFNSINICSTTNLDNAADSLKEQIEIKIKEKLATGIDEKYRDVIIHRTEIMNYTCENGLYTITFQSAVEYVLAERKVQTKYNVELAYIQDEDKFSKQETGGILSATCPNCGGPVKVRQNNCEYCGSLLTAINIRSWKYIRYKEI